MTDLALFNTTDRYGLPARVLHWATAALILTAIPLGLVANALPYDTGEQLARKAALFSLHKTVGVAAFLVALLRILWALVQPRPAPLHPDRRAERLLGDVVHWSLYLALVMVPLSGWVHHAATTGFAPILWPLGQGLPLVPLSEAVAGAAAAAHWLFTKLLVASLVLHIAGAVKHHVVDRDMTLLRMWRGTRAGNAEVHGGWLAPVIALGIWAGAGAVSLALVPTAPGVAAQAPRLIESGNWKVQSGSLGLSVRQLGAEVSGTFSDWSAGIVFDETPLEGRYGNVRVEIASASLTLGSVSAQATGPGFLEAGEHPVAVFEAEILPVAEGGYVADGILSLRGVGVPVRLLFALEIEDVVARMQGGATLDRRDFGIGTEYGDEATVGFGVEVRVELVAQRVE